MLAARYRMTRPADFQATVRTGVRSAQPDLVVHLLAGPSVETAVPEESVKPRTEPLVGLVVGKTVGNAVERHRVARKLRHTARALLDDLTAGDRLVIRALPGSRDAVSARLEAELHTGLDRARRRSGRPG